MSARQPENPVPPDMRFSRAHSLREREARGRQEKKLVVAAAVIVPIVCSLGIYFIRHLPAGSAVDSHGSVINVQLMSRAAPTHALDGKTQSEEIEPIDVPETPVTEAADRFALVPETSSAPPPPSSMQAAASRNAAVEAYMRRLSDHIRPYLHYPEDALFRGMTGRVMVQFALERNGKVQAIHIKTSSGHMVLDKAAIAAVMRAQPLPEMPSDLGEGFVFNLPMDYGLL